MFQDATFSKRLDDEIQIVVFRLNNENLAFDIDNVKEIIRIPAITKVPNSSHHLEGIINLRGQVKSVFNLKSLLNLDDTARSTNGRIIVLEKESGTVGAVVDSVLGVSKISKERLTDPASLLGEKFPEYVKGIAKMSDMIIVLLDSKKLFSREDAGLS